MICHMSRVIREDGRIKDMLSMVELYVHSIGEYAVSLFTIFISSHHLLR